MSQRRITFTLDAGLDAAARELAGGNVSGYIARLVRNDVLRNQLWAEAAAGRGEGMGDDFYDQVEHDHVGRFAG